MLVSGLEMLVLLAAEPAPDRPGLGLSGKFRAEIGGGLLVGAGTGRVRALAADRVGRRNGLPAKFPASVRNDVRPLPGSSGLGTFVEAVTLKKENKALISKFQATKNHKDSMI